MDYKQFAQHIKDNGITLAKTTKDFRGIPKGTKLWFGLDGEVINTWNNFTDNKNKEFNYDFDYEWRGYWKNLYKGSFELVEEEIKTMNYKQFTQHIKDNGITLAKTTEEFRKIPEGTKLWFNYSKVHKHLDTYNNETNNKNKDFNYNFDYEWSNNWKNLYKGSFELVEEELKGFAPDKNAKELGIDTSRKFVVLKENVSDFDKGEIITLKEDDDTHCPFFWKKDRPNFHCVYWQDLAYAPTEKKNKYLKIPGASYMGNTNIINKPNIIKKSMSLIKNAMKSNEDKALEYFNLGDTKDLNDAGRVEFTDFIFETGKTDRKEFLDYIVGLHKEKTK